MKETGELRAITVYSTGWETNGFFSLDKASCFRYDSSTGTFTVPPGGDGFYYFSVYCTVWPFQYAVLSIRINGETICEAYGDASESNFSDFNDASCSAATYANGGRTR